MNRITYSKDEINRLFSSWSTIMDIWDDKKAKEISSKYFQQIFQCANQLMSLSDEIHITINSIADKVDSI